MKASRWAISSSQTSLLGSGRLPSLAHSKPPHSTWLEVPDHREPMDSSLRRIAPISLPYLLPKHFSAKRS